MKVPVLCKFRRQIHLYGFKLKEKQKDRSIGHHLQTHA
jgi:hypothetical protein